MNNFTRMGYIPLKSSRAYFSNQSIDIEILVDIVAISGLDLLHAVACFLKTRGYRGEDYSKEKLSGMLFCSSISLSEEMISTLLSV